MERAIPHALIATALIAAHAAVHADVLSFDGDICSAAADGSGAYTACGNFVSINQAYGDTAAVDVSYVYQTTTPASSMQFWFDSYSGMERIAFGGVDPAITLTALGGNLIALNGFSIGSWPNVARDSQVQVTDLATNTLILDTGVITISGAVPTDFSFVNATSAVGFRIQFGPEGYNVGIDNISFTTAPVPEPGAWALWAAGLAGLVLARRGRSARAGR